MPTDPAERSRAAVAVSCLEWLRCTGPAVGPSPVRVREPAVVELLRAELPTGPDRVDGLGPAGHPLWDRWLDG